jgi:hypothetical protein
MAKVHVTGMSGTGKSSSLRLLSARGHRTVNTDTDEWSYLVDLPDGSRDWIWRERAIAELLRRHSAGSLLVAGCKTNQAEFYAQFDQSPCLVVRSICSLPGSGNALTTRMERQQRNVR